MSRTRCIVTGGTGCLLAALTSLVLFLPPARAENSERAITEQQDRQRLIQAETERVVRRIETLMRVLEYNRLDKSAEKKLLDETFATLTGLSREQMQAVIDALERARKATGEAQTQELKEAQERHETIVHGLKGLLAKYDAVKSLDQAADRLDKSARDELDLYVQNLQVIHDQQNLNDRRRSATPTSRAQKLAGDQSFVLRDVTDLLKQAADLREQLPAEQKERLKKAETYVKDQQLQSGLETASKNLRGAGYVDNRLKLWGQAADLQWTAAGDLQELARLLRGSPDKLAALREVRQRLDWAIKEQEGLRDDTLTPFEPNGEKKAAEEMEELRRGRGIIILRRQVEIEQEDPVARHGQGLSDRQVWLEHDIRDTRQVLRPHVEELAAKLIPAEKAMREAEPLLRKYAPKDAAAPQERALDTLKAVKTELDRLIAEAERDKYDPLASLKNALEKVEQILKEEKDVRDKTEDAVQGGREQRLPLSAPRQQDLARRTDEVRQQPMPAKQETFAALEKASQAMTQAAQSLQQQKGADAVARQDRAIESLEEAKKLLAEQVAEIEKRRQDIAALEDAAKKLGELIKEETKVADQARQRAQQSPTPDTKPLANRQAELTPQARAVGQQVQSQAPEAAKNIAAAAQHMDAAQAQLGKQQPAPAAKQADAAVQQLTEAQKALAKALEQMRGQEAAAQAATQPNMVDPANAAQQIAKALEQTQQAANQSQAAAAQLNQPMNQTPATPVQPNLAQLQQQVADQAAKMDLKQAQTPAAQAAQQLQKGNLQAAIQQQQKALAQLQQAANAQQAQPMGNQPMGNQPMGNQPMGNQPMGNQPMGNQPMGNQPMRGQPQNQGAPMPANAQNAAQLAQAQQALMNATQALAQSQASNQAAMAALGQAQAQAPRAVQPQLQQAGQQLAQAGQQAQQGMAAQAGQSQAQAAAQLQQALQTLNSAMASAAQQGQGQGQQGQGQQGQGQQGQGQQGQGQGQGQQGQGQGQGQQGQGQGQQGQGQGRGQGQGQGQQPGRSQEQNQARGSGNRVADGTVSNTASQLGDVKGDGTFLNLPPRQRELIKQALTEKMPPEFAALIQQYYLNIAKGKPATPPPAQR